MNEKLPKAIYGSPDNPLSIGDFEIPCYVLDDNRRVLVQSGMISALDMSHGGTGGTGGDRLAKFASGKAISPFVSNELVARTAEPIRFRTPRGAAAYGYEATILADICEAVLAAKDAGALQKQQLHIAKQCEILVRGFARVGIIALVDEATGYQDVRARKALEEILDKFIAEELRKWAKTFPDEFYKQMFRLRGWSYTPWSVKRPSAVGKYTNDLVYQRLAPGVLQELKRRNPTDEKGRRKVRHHQWLTEDVGHPRLREHLAAVMALMKASTSWDQFRRSLQRALPKYGTTLDLPLDD